MPIRKILWSILGICLLLITRGSRVRALGLTTINLTTSRGALLADGKHTATLRAEVHDSTGRPVTTGVTVEFQTTSGTLSQTRVQTIGGIAQVNLTSSPVAGVAHVTAAVPGQAVSTLDVLFTDDPEATFDGNNYLLFAASTYLAYSSTDKIIEADGKNGGGRMTFRNMELTADRIQLHCDDLIIRARDNIVLKRGKDVIYATRLYYSIPTSQGYAIANVGNELKLVTINGEHLRLDPGPDHIPQSYINMPDFQVKLVIVARGITFFPNDRLQFRRAQFFQDNVRLLSLPYYEMPLGSTQLFSDQFFSFGTSGFGMDLPLYFELSPRTTGIAYIRHQEQIGRGYYSTEPGWAIDLIRGYSNQGDQRYEGAYGFTGLTRSDWGMRWNHTQEFNSETQGSFDIQFPHHDSIYGSTNFTQQFQQIRWGANITAGQTFLSEPTTNTQSNIYVETQPHRLMGSHFVLYTFGNTFTSAQTKSVDPTVTPYNQTTDNLNMRAFIRPLALDKRTTLTPSVTIGHSWALVGASGNTALSTISLDRTLIGGGTINLTYDYVTQPGPITTGGKHRVSSSYTFAAAKRLQVNVFGSFYLDTTDSNMLADLSYKLDKRWRLLGSFTLQRYNDLSYQDFEFTIGRQIGERELQLNYSTFNRRVSVDLTATHF